MSIPGYKKLETWRVCRIDPVFHLDPDKREYGHWWIEIDEEESYGFWPTNRVGLLGTFFGVEGAVNPRTFSPTPTQDLHHGDTTTSVPGLREFDVWAPEGIDEEQLREEVRRFSANFRARWAWPATPLTGENFHSFQEKLLQHVGLKIAPSRP